MGGVRIRPATKDDMIAVAEMTRELADFQKMPNGPRIKVKDLQRDGFDSQFPAFKCFVAELQGAANKKVIGYAVYYPIYSTWQGKSMMLQDLYVRTAERLRGVGHRLFNAVAKVVEFRNVSPVFSTNSLLILAAMVSMLVTMVSSAYQWSHTKFAEACASDCSRLDFHVLKSNAARAFYEKKGAVNLTELEEWCFYRLTGGALLEAGSKSN